MRPSLWILVAATALTLPACESTPDNPKVPPGFQLIYSQDFESSSWLTDFAVSDPAVWVPGIVGDTGTFLITGPGERIPPHGGPKDYALLGGVMAGPFVLDFDVMPVGSVSELLVFFAVESKDQYVYASLAPRAGPRSHDVFRVDNAQPLPISTRRSFGVELTPGVWQSVRVQRLDLAGRVSIAIGNPPTLQMEARNGALAPGWLGFGVSGGAAHFDHMRLYAPDYDMRSIEHLPAAGQSRK